MFDQIATVFEPSMIDQIADAIQKFTSAIASHFIGFLTAMAGVGILTMAILQAIKDTFPVRRAFQRQWLKRWLRCKAEEAIAIRKKLETKETDVSANPETAEADLIKLATDGNANALYDLPIEQLCGQFNAAIQVTLDSPSRHRDLLTTTASLADPKDLQLLFEPPDEAKRPVSLSDPNQSDRRQQFIDARTRVTHQVQRAIDSIQISAGFRWKLYLQYASFGLSAVIAGLGVALFIHQPPASDKTTAFVRTVLTVGVTGVLGGFLAPVARDLVAALQQLRK
jgi:hypothetical protein